MNEFVVKVFYVKFFTASSDIGVLVKIAVYMSIEWSHEAIASEIKFAIMDKKGVIDVFLDYECFVFDISGFTASTNIGTLLY